MLTNMKAYLLEGDETVRRELTTVLSFAGIGLAGGSEDADFALLGASSQGALPGIPTLALDGRADPNRTEVVSRLPFPFSHFDLNAALQHLQTARAMPGCRGGVRFRELVGRSPVIERVREMMARVADRDVTILITGESGTGKEVVARALHDHSLRKGGPFVPVNCGAIPSELLESELFGHEKGAFTGAITNRIGRFELAKGGTLFLDEIGDLPLHMQVKLLRAIQERCFERVGGSETIRADVRIIAATHKNLETMIEQGQFRDDLFYRLNVFPIDMPPLRERVGDVPLLIENLLTRLTRDGRGSVRFSPSAVASLVQHEWSGNIRELANLIERMAIMHPGGVVAFTDLPRKFQHGECAATLDNDAANDSRGTPPLHTVNDIGHARLLDPDATPLLPVNGIDLREYMTRLERSLIQQALDDSNSVVAHAADRLHIRRTTLVEKMRKYGLGRVGMEE